MDDIQHIHQKSRSICVLSNLLFLAVLFPYLSLAKTPFDTQPWALIIAMIITLGLMATNNLKLPTTLLFLFLIGLYAIILYPLSLDLFNGLRSLIGYVSICFIALASYKTYKYVSTKIYIGSIMIWLAVGITQLLYDNRFMEFILPRLATGGPRGVTALAVEPSYYSIMCVFFLLLNEFFYYEKKYGTKLYYIFLATLVFQIIISYSVTGILFLVLFAIAKTATILIRGSYRMRRWSAIFLVIIISLTTIVSFLHIESLQKTRAGDILVRSKTNPINILYQDESIARRTVHLLLPWYGLFDSKGFGRGLGSWGGEQISVLIISSPGWFQKMAETAAFKGGGPAGRIMSGWGSAIYELGLVGVLLIFIVLQIMITSIRRNIFIKSACVVSGLTFFGLMTTAVPLAFPFAGYLIGMHLYYGHAGKER